MKLFFVRHGESVANVEKVISNRGFQHPLTDRGKQQVVALGESMKNIEISHIYTSPLQRAVQTAEILTNASQVEYEVVDALREGDCGILEGRGDDESWQMLMQLGSEWFDKGNFSARIEGGESYNDITSRFVPFIDGIVKAYSHTEKSIVFVGHGVTLMIGLSQIFTNIDAEYATSQPIHNACYIKAEMSAGGLICTEWCGETVTNK